MKFPNAAKGVKNIYTAEILELLSNVAGLITAILAVIAALSLKAESAGGLLVGGIGAAVLGIAALVLGVIAFFMTLSGINAAKLDEPIFKNALIALLVGILLEIIAACFSNELVKNLCHSLSFACNMLITYYIVQGVGALADKLANKELSDKCKSFLKLLMTVWIIAVILRAVGSFLSSNVATAVIGSIVAVAAIAAAIVAYIMFLGLLKQGKEMLEAAKADPAAPEAPAE